MPVTIKNIAAELGLSVSAVSKALNDYPDIAPQTRQLVKETARRMGYRASAAARSLRTHKTNTIGLILCLLDRHLTDPYSNPKRVVKSPPLLYTPQRTQTIRLW